MDGQRLDGWKAIANFLGRDRTTAIRWANDRGLPVHRVPGGGSGSVFAHTSELEQWLAGADRRPEASPVAQPATGERLPAELPIAGPAPSVDARPSPSPRSGWLRRHALKLAAFAVVVAVAAMLCMRDQAKPPPSALVGIAPIVSPAATAETIAFADALTADLARFADASNNIVVFERSGRHQPDTRYVAYTNIDRGPAGLAADVRLVATENREVMWSRHFAPTSAPSALRAQLAAKLIGTLRCSLDSLAGDGTQASTTEIANVMSACDAFDDGDVDRAFARARRLTETSPKLGAGWALRAAIGMNLVEQGILDRRSVRESAARAIELAPDNMLAAIAKAKTAGPGASSPEALPILEDTLRRHPDHPWLLTLQSMALFNLGYVQASVPPAIASVRTDPSSQTSRDTAVRRLAAAGRMTEALSLQAENEGLWPGHPNLKKTRSRILAVARRVPEVEADGTLPSNPYLLARIYEARGDRQAALRWLAKAPDDRTQMQWSLLFWPEAAGLRTEPAFFDKMVKLGLVKWWVARRQWPDFCAEPNLKYSCAREAAKRRITT